MNPRSSILLLATSSALLLAACERSADAPTVAAPASAASRPAGAAPVSVTTVLAVQRDMEITLEATGTVVALASVEVKPQVTGLVTAVHVKEGQFVRTGERLFTLDSRADQANVAKLRAQMAKNEASLADAQRQLLRSQELKAKSFVSQGAVDTNQSQVDSQAAAVAADRAALEAARLTLSYSQIVAPSAGRVGAVAIYPGSLVQANQTGLVTITQLDPVDVAFSVPQRYLSDVLDSLKGGGAEVRAALPEQAGTVKGRLSFVDNAVDAGSGTIKLKARFDNRETKLWPGAFAKVSLTVRTLKDAVVVPQAALIQSARGTLVYVVEDGKAVARPVKLVYAEGEQAAVTGAKPGEKIVLDGRQNVRPEAAVVEREVAPAKVDPAPTAARASAPDAAKAKAP